ncbi:ATP-binding cassette domain-containing protein [Paenibacillus sp. MMS18-CY102]|uniref:ATP-binding cassette domain-containing protein n=1 Tax=Paenibacillus sp. MMS18-CY102 TaxID=2682849 RepID=UPI0013664B48|nr:ATP-binding cassette domain-containing protein [Paenibacillus sp. MMS18-CY102]MWC29022.1 ATP-binding cassette domain-containing protein [Paenibacillus sp. MMS18-CY102]
MLTANRLGKRYKSGWALHPISVSFGPGMHGLLGPNGAGKSTLLRMLAGLLAPTTGDAELHGLSVRHGYRSRQHIGFVPQAFRMHAQLSGIETVKHSVMMRGVSARVAASASEAALAAVGLTETMDWAVRNYSSGMVKRLGIAQAIACGPDVLIVDEPTAGLDPEERVKLRSVLAELSQTKAVILSTHVLSDVGICRDIHVLCEGRLLYSGGKEELASHAKGQVWRWETSESEWRRQPAAGIIAAKRTFEGLECRALSMSMPHPYAIETEPSMEEGYLALISSSKLQQ